MAENGVNSAPSDKVIDLIRKCLALADSPNENEAALAMAKAQELLERYNLSLAQVKDTVTTIPDLIEGEVDYEHKEWLRRLFFTVARHNFCKTVGHPSTGKESIIGRYTNVCMTVEMAYWLRSQIERIAMEETTSDKLYQFDSSTGTINHWGVPSTREYRKGFLVGIVARISQRLQELADQRRTETPSLTALTVNLMAEATGYMTQLYPRLVKGTMSTVNSYGYNAGLRAGDRVGLTPPSRHVDGGPLRLNSGC